ncbi:ABC transporter ATP-binding protein [Treponema denticola]|uniref:ABC transporter ATP-binding protein n=1 Tax=Treponema denticola TaxID=158 RepID=UPI0020A3C602|nr:ABC transporter ATP-binding protein [Treponema denticola]UTC94350.1 ABC transporter ATP-binding protein [Treponema denticola]
MVELKNVSFRYGSENAECMYASSLKNIDLTVKTGECVLLTGPSGCGKTTILRLINGLIPHFYPGELSGDIFIDGGSVKERELYDTALIIGTVFQNPRTQFYNVDTTGELAFGCENRGLPEQEIYTRIDRTVAHFRMASLMDRNIFRLSDGEKQKIACASVNVSEPKIILLDEPSANLDYTATLMLRELILRWKAEGKTIIAAEHRIAYLWDIIDRAVILRDGEIVGEFTGNGKEELTQNQLTQMGLRTTVTESPAEMQMDSFREGDRPITLRNFHFAYHGEKKNIVDIPILQIAAGQITAIVGANGAGKTSFLNCFCGLEKRCKGTLEYEGKLYDSKSRKKLCFMVMQDTGNQLFTESVLDEVLISLKKGTANEKETAMEIIRNLDLADFADRHPQSLSGGQKQRLAIACALASGRELLLLDEPTSGLDYAHMKETAALLEKLRSMGTTILVVTHDSELIRACCTRRITV